MKKQIILPLLLTVLAFSLAAKEPVFVDITEANETLAILQAQNDAAAQQISELNSDIDALLQNNEVQVGNIVEARELIADLGVSRGELYAARNRTNDLDQKKRVAEKLEKNMGQEHQLQLVIEKFNETIEKNNFKITADKKQIARDNIQSVENNMEITFLQSCISITSDNENNLEDIFSRQDGNSSAYDAFMSANQE
jgi:multidrug efflux pump subunit AcrB